MAITLYEISARQEAINAVLEENGGELTPELEEALTINQEEMSCKAEAYAASIEKYDDMARLLKEKKQELERKQRICENISKRLKEKIKDAMEAFNYQKMDVGTRKLSIRKSCQVDIYDATSIPGEYIKVETSFDKAKLMSDLKALPEGEQIRGAKLVFNTSLQVR